MSSPARGSGQRLEVLMDAMEGTSLTALQRMIVLTLARHADHKTGANARPGHRTLAAEAGAHRDSVGPALDAAERLGLIRATSREPGRSTVYTILPRIGGT